MPYPYEADDPDAIPDTASKRERSEQTKNLRKYSQAMFSAYQRISTRRELFWYDFVKAFRPHTIRSWYRPIMTEWCALITKRGLRLDLIRGKPMSEAIIDILYKYLYNGTNDSTEFLSINKAIIAQDAQALGENKGELVETDILNYNMREMTLTENAPSTHTLNPVDTAENETDESYTDKTGGPGDLDEDSSSDGEDDDARIRRVTDRGNRKRGIHFANPIERGPKDEQYANTRSMGINGVMKEFTGKTEFSGAYEEDLDDTLDVFETMARMCSIKNDEKSQSIPIMLKGDALSLLSRKSNESQTYEERVDML